MKVKQIANVLNDVFAESVGEENQFKEDLSNFVDVFESISGTLNLGDNKWVEGIFNSLVDRIGKTMIDSKMYKAEDWGIYKDAWEYGSILQKIRVETGEFHDNEVWDLNNYIPTVFDYETPADVTVKYVNGKKTMEAKLCTMTKQLKEAFISASKMNEFISALETRVKTKIEFAREQLARRTITDLIAEKIKSGSYVDLASAYNTKTGKTITLETAPYDRDFLEFVAREMKTYTDYIQEFSQLYNDDEYNTFTNKADIHLIINNEVANGIETTLPANTFNERFLKMNGYKTINYWQSPKASGKTEFGARTSINVIPASEGSFSGDAEDDTRKYVSCGSGVGVIGVMFDDKACMITNEEPYTDTIYNPEGRFFKTWHRFDANYCVDAGENVIVFTIGTPTVTDPTA